MTASHALSQLSYDPNFQSADLNCEAANIEFTENTDNRQAV
jgi:hypothetical protein